MASLFRRRDQSIGSPVFLFLPRWWFVRLLWGVPSPGPGNRFPKEIFPMK